MLQEPQQKDVPRDLAEIKDRLVSALDQAGLYNRYGGGLRGDNVSVSIHSDLGRTRIGLAGKIPKGQEENFWQVMSRFETEGSKGQIEFYPARMDGQLLIAVYNPAAVGA